MKQNAKRSKNEIKHETNMDSSDNEDYDAKIAKLEFNMPKPSAHAKAGEWRKWKEMQKKIRTIRMEKKLLKKQKTDEEHEENQVAQNELRVLKEKGRNYTLSIAISGSLIEKVQSKELKTYVCGQLARAATIYCVDEIIVYNESPNKEKLMTEDENQLMIKIFEYLECPQYLRKAFFQPQKLLEYVGLLNPLDAPHHLRLYDEWKYREGVTTDLSCKDENGCYVDIGLQNKILVDKKIKPGVRVTVKKHTTEGGKTKGLIVSPSTPCTQDNIYWGYQVRYADSFRKILHECPHKEGYDLTIGSSGNSLNFDCLNDLDSKFEHVLIVFGGPHGMQASLESDEKFKINNPKELFSILIDGVSKNIGSKSIRSEEAILITLSQIKSKLDNLTRCTISTNSSSKNSKIGKQTVQNEESDDESKEHFIQEVQDEENEEN